MIFKGVAKSTVVEITLGVLFAIMLANILGNAFSRTPFLGTFVGHMEEAEDAEDFESMEHFGGRGRARRRARKKKRHAKKTARLQAIVDQGDDDASQAYNDAYTSQQGGDGDDDQDYQDQDQDQDQDQAA